MVTIGNLSFAASKQYKAVFSDATGVAKGDDVRVAGVKVGSVKGIEIFDRTRALVTFKVDKDQQLTDGTNATIRYRNLVGQRYISLAQGVGGPGVLKEGDTIPLARTNPALDLTVLFNGFKPLFAALSPADINKLSYEIVTVFQGEGGTLESLLSHTASVTSTLASRDQVIGSLIDEPQPGDGDHRQPGRAALRPADQAAAVRLGAVRRPAGDPRVAGLDLRAGGADLRPGHRHPARR